MLVTKAVQLQVVCSLAACFCQAVTARTGLLVIRPDNSQDYCTVSSYRSKTLHRVPLMSEVHCIRNSCELLFVHRFSVVPRGIAGFTACQ
jgi:hypothetical protein